MPRIDQIYAFVAEEEPGDEGIVAMPIGDKWLPLIGSDMERVDDLKIIAKSLAKSIDKPIRLILFSERTELEVINP